MASSWDLRCPRCKKMFEDRRLVFDHFITEHPFSYCRLKRHGIDTLIRKVPGARESPMVQEKKLEQLEIRLNGSLTVRDQTMTDGAQTTPKPLASVKPFTSRKQPLLPEPPPNELLIVAQSPSANLMSNFTGFPSQLPSAIATSLLEDWKFPGDLFALPTGFANNINNRNDQWSSPKKFENRVEESCYHRMSHTPLEDEPNVALAEASVFDTSLRLSKISSRSFSDQSDQSQHLPMDSTNLSPVRRYSNSRPRNSDVKCNDRFKEAYNRSRSKRQRSPCGSSPRTSRPRKRHRSNESEYCSKKDSTSLSYCRKRSNSRSNMNINELNIKSEYDSRNDSDNRISSEKSHVGLMDAAYGSGSGVEEEDLENSSAKGHSSIDECEIRKNQQRRSDARSVEHESEYGYNNDESSRGARHSSAEKFGCGKFARSGDCFANADTNDGIMVPCLLCNEYFSNPKETLDHENAEHRVSLFRYACPLCPFNQACTTVQLKQHLERFHNCGERMVVACALCDRKFRLWNIYLDHIQCDYRTRRLRHYRQVAVEGPIKCMSCKIIFNDVDVWRKHRTQCPENENPISVRLVDGLQRPGCSKHLKTFCNKFPACKAKCLFAHANCHWSVECKFRRCSWYHPARTSDTQRVCFICK